MRLLVLGGTRFVGRAVVEAALARGDDVTVLNRGLTGSVPDGAELVPADRTDHRALNAVLGSGGWDAVVDTWSGAPEVVRLSAGVLRGRVGHYGYVSSRSVYRYPVPPEADESAEVVDGDPGAGEVDYAQAKRGGELAVLESFPESSLLARAGLVLGPYENVGRLVWWLRRLERGGDVAAPGPPDQPLQYIDARDLAGWMLRAAEQGTTGAYNAVSPCGHTTMRELLETVAGVVVSDSRLVWLTPGQVREAGIAEWQEFPVWLAPDSADAGLHRGDVSRALAAGLTLRTVRDTVVDTWAWMQSEGEPAPPPGRPAPGLEPGKEAAARALAG